LAASLKLLLSLQLGLDLLLSRLPGTCLAQPQAPDLLLSLLLGSGRTLLGWTRTLDGKVVLVQCALGMAPSPFSMLLLGHCPALFVTMVLVPVTGVASGFGIS
jgi:hypothetical protein